MNISKPKRIKIKYISQKLKSWQTDRTISFECEINGVKAQGRWEALYRTISQGVDINELEIRIPGENFSKLVEIFVGGGSSKTYEIYARDLPLHKSQPKSFQFTGQRLDVSILKQVFISKIQTALEDPEMRGMLSEDFIKVFNLDQQINSGKG